MMHTARFTCGARRLFTGLGTLAGIMFGFVVFPDVAQGQWSTSYEQFYLPGRFNFTFRREYPAADRLFNAFDYGHAILYERLYNDAHAPVSQLEDQEFNFITRKLLVSPPRLPLEEAAIEVNYAKMAPEAKAMFDWAHLLHRQIYDVLASERMSQSEKDAMIAELVAYYKTRPDLAFSSRPKNMELMESQPYSLAFRQRYPKFNGLIWGYHWLQVGLYEPLMIGRSQEERQAGVSAAVSRFRQMLENAPEHMPRVMPMTAAVAPTFAARYQEASIIFDNLHAMHDVVSDILANDVVPHGGKRAAILAAASRYRDDQSFLMPVSEWAGMGAMMGIENMGGPAVGVLVGWPTPTLAHGSTMVDAMKRMPGMTGMAGMSHGTAASPGAAHSMAGMSGSSAKAPAMKGMTTGDSASHEESMPGMSATSGAGKGMKDSVMRQLHERMMKDPVIHARMMADTAMRRLMSGMPTDASSMHMTHETAAVTPSAPARRKASSTKSSVRKTSPTRKAPAKRAKRAKPATHDMPGMNMKGMPGMKP
ncbi:MAG: hypothetical protein H0W68_06900 [Gemmatimonadaceae bacterium]|nr:hypothetical protein [Gemmatimonadaceae bacterium]